MFPRLQGRVTLSDLPDHNRIQARTRASERTHAPFMATSETLWTQRRGHPLLIRYYGHDHHAIGEVHAKMWGGALTEVSMVDELDEMSRSEDWRQRVRAAHLIARCEPGERDAIALRLLQDPKDTAVTEAMVEALVQERREAAVPLIVSALASDPDEQDDGEDYGSGGDYIVGGLSNARADGIDVDGAIARVVLESDNRQELVGALDAIVWFTQSGGFDAPPELLVRLQAFIQHPDYAIRALAWHALEALSPPTDEHATDQSPAKTIAGDAPVDRALDAFYTARNPTERTQAAERLAELGDANTAGVVRRWFNGPDDPPPPDSLARALLGPSPETRSPLVLRALGQAPSGPRYDEARAFLLQRLLHDWKNGADAPFAIGAALEARRRDHDEVIGALLATAQLAPSGCLSLPPRALEFINLLSDDPRESHTRQLARAARAALEPQ